MGFAWESSSTWCRASRPRAGPGLGPWENYPDRSASALLGAWESPIDEMSVPYIVAQENGTRGGTEPGSSCVVRQGVVEIEMAEPLHINVARHTVAELEAADHWWKLA